MSVPTLSTVVLDCPDPRALADFYAKLLDWPTIEGDDDWVTIKNGDARIDFQRIDDYATPTWPGGDKPQMLHLDFSVDDLAAGQERAVALGAQVLDESSTSYHVLADPAGHPFCLCS